MPTYRKLTNDEILAITSQIRYSDCIDYDVIRDLITEFYGSEAHKVICSYGSEYNDETYDLSLQSVQVFDKAGNEIERKGEDDDEIENKWLDAKYEIQRIADLGSEDDSACFDITIFMDEKLQPAIPELYIKE